MKTYGGLDVSMHVFLTSALVGGEWSASRPGRFTPPRIHWIGSWVDLRAGLDDVERRTILILLGLVLRPLSSRARSQSLYRPSYLGSYILKQDDETVIKANRFQGSNCVSGKEEAGKPRFVARPSRVVGVREVVVGGGYGV
jgi:hypothetical protein